VADHGFEFSNIGMVETSVVRQVTLDQLIADRKLKPSFIKIDVEGYEGEVLHGSMEVIKSCKPILMIEIEKRHNKKFPQVFALLGSQGYVPYHFQSGKLWLSGAAVVEESFEYFKSSNVSGIKEVTVNKNAGRYLNNFVFLPMS
jgi:hypothetical protein